MKLQVLIYPVKSTLVLSASWGNMLKWVICLIYPDFKGFAKMNMVINSEDKAFLHGFMTAICVGLTLNTTV